MYVTASITCTISTDGVGAFTTNNQNQRAANLPATTPNECIKKQTSKIFLRATYYSRRKLLNTGVPPGRQWQLRQTRRLRRAVGQWRKGSAHRDRVSLGATGSRVRNPKD